MYIQSTKVSQFHALLKSSQDTWLSFKVRTLGHKFETAFERVVAYNWSPMAGIKCVQPHCSLLVSAGQKHRTGAPRQHVDSTWTARGAEDTLSGRTRPAALWPYISLQLLTWHNPSAGTQNSACVLATWNLRMLTRDRTRVRNSEQD